MSELNVRGRVDIKSNTFLRMLFELLSNCEPVSGSWEGRIR